MFLQIKDIKHIEQGFCSDVWVMPQGWDLGGPGVPRGSIKFEHGHVAYQIDEKDERNRIQVKIITLGQTGDLGMRSKFQLQSQFQRFLYQTLCVFSQIKDIKRIEGIFILSPGSCPRVGLGGAW